MDMRTDRKMVSIPSEQIRKIDEVRRADLEGYTTGKKIKVALQEWLKQNLNSRDDKRALPGNLSRKKEDLNIKVTNLSPEGIQSWPNYQSEQFLTANTIPHSSNTVTKCSSIEPHQRANYSGSCYSSARF